MEGSTLRTAVVFTEQAVGNVPDFPGEKEAFIEKT